MKATLIIIAICWCCTGCYKETVPAGTSSLTIINAVVGSTPLVTNFGTEPLQWYKTAQQLSYGTYNATINAFSAYTGTVNLVLHQYPDTAAHNSPLYNLALNLPTHTIHTLFLVGQVASPDTLFTTDTPPYHSSTDSTTGIRFVNLSPNSTGVSVNIKGQANGSEISSLPYKGITTFKNYGATKAVSSYIFEIRDATTNALLTTYTLSGFNAATNSPRFRNVTIALKGLTGGAGTSALGTFLINNF